MSKTVVFLLCTAVLAFASPVRGDVKFQREGFTISFPDGWVEIPRAAIDSYEKKMAELAPGKTVQHYDSGYQREGSEKWFSYPYVLVQISTQHRIPENRLEQLKQSTVPNVRNEKERLSAVMSDIKVGQMAYDSRDNIIWMPLEMDIRGFGPVTGLAGIVPTESGFIQAIGYCKKDDYPKYEAAFRSILLSVTPGPELVYKPHSPDTMISWTEVAATAAAAALIAVIVGLAVRSWRKKRLNS
jgi:hypothetical protein